MRSIARRRRFTKAAFDVLLGAMGEPLTPALFRLNPMFDPPRGDPRFKKLAAAVTPNKRQP